MYRTPLPHIVHVKKRGFFVSNQNSIVSLGDLSKPADTLIKKIAKAVGGIFHPAQIRRVAHAEADARKIEALSQIEVSELQHRALQRFLVEEAHKQKNIEDITRKALPYVDDDANPGTVENDWIANFFDKCRLVSDDEMQELWAKLLAGEANSPGKYSRRTLALLASLDKYEAELFTSLCSFTVELGGRVALVYDLEDEVYNDAGINFSSVMHLESMGLVSVNNLTGFLKKGLAMSGNMFYLGTPIWIGFAKPSDNNLNIGKVLMTKAGQQLSAVCSPKPIPGFTDYLREKWRKFGHTTEEPKSRT